jgi:hypothetical protein
MGLLVVPVALPNPPVPLMEAFEPGTALVLAEHATPRTPMLKSTANKDTLFIPGTFLKDLHDPNEKLRTQQSAI